MNCWHTFVTKSVNFIIIIMCSFTDLSKSQEMETPTELSSMTGGGGSWIIYSEREREREKSG